MKMNDNPIAHTEDGRPLYDNTPTVVCVAVHRRGRIMVVRRATDPGLGKLALPGGYHMRGESWQECGVREVQEETGLKVEPKQLHLDGLVTDEYGNNLVLSVAFFWKDIDFDQLRINPQEVQELFFLTAEEIEKADWAFPLHKDLALRIARGQIL